MIRPIRRWIARLFAPTPERREVADRFDVVLRRAVRQMQAPRPLASALEPGCIVHAGRSSVSHPKEV